MKYLTRLSVFLFLLISVNARSQTSIQSTPAAPVSSAPAPAPPEAADNADAKKNKAEVQVNLGGGVMLSSKDIYDNLIAAPDYSQLSDGLKKAGLAETLQGKGVFTIFAPTNEAFAKLSPGTLDSLQTPRQESRLTAILTYHVVSGKMGLKDLVKAIRKGDGEASLTTLSGSILKATIEDETMTLTDENGRKAHISRFDIEQNNGVLHVLDDVLLPKEKLD